MKLLHIIENIDNSYGGPARSVPFLIKYLNRVSVQNKIVSIRLKESETNDICRENSIETLSVEYNGPKVARYGKKLCRTIESELDDATILHTHSLWNYPPYCAYKLSKKHHVPLVVSIRGNLYDWNMKKSRWKKKVVLSLFQMEMFKTASCLHATEMNEYHAIRKLGIKTPVALIPNGIELAEFENLPEKASAQKCLGLDPDKKYLLFLSRIYSKKGLEYLIKVFSAIHQESPEWELLIAGPVYDQTYFERILSTIKKNGLSKKVHFFGMVSGEKRLNLFASSNLFVLPAHTENFGMVIGEAMAARLPVITTTGTPWKILKENNAGWWIDLSEENLEKTLGEAMQKPRQSLEEMGNRGYHIIKEQFSWDEIAHKMKSVYQWLVGEGNKPSWVYED